MFQGGNSSRLISKTSEKIFVSDPILIQDLYGNLAAQFEIGS
jgi:hypothetical protein